MLETLTIKNYALLADVEIDFTSGLNVLTGETGAGKSIILGALGTILGERVDTTVVRQGTSKAIVEGVFRLQNGGDVYSYLRQQDLLPGDSLLIVRREILANGRSRAFLDDTPVPLTVLQSVGNLLVDLHGQHDHQSLLHPRNHLLFLDEFGDLHALKEKVAESFQALQERQKRISALRQKQQTAAEKRDLLLFQIEEIEKASPSAEEEERLLKEERILKNHERLFSLSRMHFDELYEKDGSVYEKLNALQNSLEELATIDERFAPFRSECESARVAVEEIAKFFQSYCAGLDFDPDRVEQIQNRMAELAALKKKYNRSISEIVDYKDEMQAQLGALENLDERLAEEQKQFEADRQAFSTLCVDLSRKRKEVAVRLEASVPGVLDYLGMPASRFKVTLESQDDPEGLVVLQGRTYRADSGGMDVAQFLISTNPGEEPKPLVKVASGGEISRIMLALKSLLARKGAIPVLVFDEIDIGVSGRMAQAVGRKLKELSRSHQVICITHLPQIASMGDQHLLVEKLQRNQRTETQIRKLTQEERTIAIARLLAGDKITETHLKSARELMLEALTN